MTPYQKELKKEAEKLARIDLIRVFGEEDKEAMWEHHKEQAIEKMLPIARYVLEQKAESAKDVNSRIAIGWGLNSQQMTDYLQQKGYIEQKEGTENGSVY